jgi:hypothetical protein
VASLLWMRAAAAVVLAKQAIIGLHGEILAFLSACVSELLGGGLWRPIAGVVLASLKCVILFCATRIRGQAFSWRLWGLH